MLCTGVISCCIQVPGRDGLSDVQLACTRDQLQVSIVFSSKF